MSVKHCITSTEQLLVKKIISYKGAISEMTMMVVVVVWCFYIFIHTYFVLVFGLFVCFLDFCTFDWNTSWFCLPFKLFMFMLIDLSSLIRVNMWFAVIISIMLEVKRNYKTLPKWIKKVISYLNHLLQYRYWHQTQSQHLYLRIKFPDVIKLWVGTGKLFL